MDSLLCQSCGEKNSGFIARCSACGATLPPDSQLGLLKTVLLSGEPDAESAPRAEVDARLGQTIVHYRIERRLGAGGMGVVYGATDTRLHRPVALKFPSAELSAVAPARDRFLREARTLSRLDHPNIGTIYEVSEHEDQPFIAMALYEGETLAERIARGPLTIDEITTILEQIAAGLAAAHAAGVIHRDIKPANVMLTRDRAGPSRERRTGPRVKLLDFGLAKVLSPLEGSSDSHGQALVGTIPYMAPEQLRAEAVGPRADLWALGVVAYEMLTGETPFHAERAADVLTRILTIEPRPLAELRDDVPAHVEALVMRLLQKRAGERPESADEVVSALVAGPPRETGTERTGPPLAIPAAPRGSRRVSLAIGGAAIVLAVAGYRFNANRAVDPAAPVEPAGARPIRRSVAVLGFKNLSGRPEAAWLSTAFSEMLGAELSAGGRLRTIPSENVARTRTELSLTEVDSLDRDALDRVQKRLGADVIVLGSYVALGDKDVDKIRLDIRVERASGGAASSISEMGTKGEIFDVMARAGARLRAMLDGGELTAKEAQIVRASRPASPEAARLYAEGLTRLRLRDTLAARDTLLAAVLADPDYPLAHAALAEAWSVVGYDEKAKEEAKRAFELSAGLSREERLLVEGKYQSSYAAWDKAVAIYRGLFGFFPDNLEYGLLLADAESKNGNGKDALATVEALRKLPPPARDDPRIDLLEAQAAESLTDFKREQEAAGRALAKAEADGARHLSARARLPLAYTFLRLGDPARALATYEEARAIFEAVGDRAAEARAMSNIAMIRAQQGELEAARKLIEEVLAIHRATGNRSNYATALNNLANVVGDQGEVAASGALYEEALAIFRELGDRRGASSTLGNIGWVFWRKGDYAAARRTFEEELVIERALGAEVSIADTTSNLATILYEQGDLAGAKETFQESLALSRKLEDKRGIAAVVAGLGDVLYQEAEIAGAQRRYEESLALYEELGEKTSAAEQRIDLAALALAQGEPVKAEALARDAQAALHDEQLSTEVSGYCVLVDALLAQGKRAEAAAAIERAAKLPEPADAPAIRIALVIAAARAHAASGEPAAIAGALKKVEAAITEADRAPRATALEARLALGEIEMASGRGATGRDHLAAVERDAGKMGFHRIAKRAAALRK